MNDTNNKGLHRFTKINTCKGVKDYMKDKDVEEAARLAQYYSTMLDKTYKEKAPQEISSHRLVNLIMTICECVKQMGYADTTEDNRHMLWEGNHQAIWKAFHNLILRHGALPTKSALARETGLSRPTIDKHLNEDDLFGKYMDKQIQMHRKLVPQALTMMYEMGMKGNHRALKSFIDYVHTSTKTTTINNYIQINNLQVTPEQITALPAETLIQIEQIITKAMGNEAKQI